MQFVDFDGVRFHMSTPSSKTVLLLSMHIRCWAELEGYGALDIMRREYGSLLSATPEPEYNVSLEIDLAGFPPEGGKQLNSLSDTTEELMSIEQKLVMITSTASHFSNATPSLLHLSAHSQSRRSWKAPTPLN